MLKKIRIFLWLIIAIIAVFFAYDNLPKPMKTDTPARIVPNIEFTDMAGKSYKLHDLKEPTIFLHFWASWCTPCLVELPDMLELAEKMDGKLAIVAVSIDTDTKKLDNFMKRLRKKHGKKVDNLHIYWVSDLDKAISLKTFGVAKVPETIVINRNREMFHKIIGDNNWLNAETKALIEP